MEQTNRIEQDLQVVKDVLEIRGFDAAYTELRRRWKTMTHSEVVDFLKALQDDLDDEKELKFYQE